MRCRPKMTSKTVKGPPDTSQLPHKSLGSIFYEAIRKWDGNRTAIVDTDDEEIDYKTILKITVKLAKKLQILGVKKNDVITILSHNHWIYLATIIAGFYVGATVNCLNPDYGVGELKKLLRICRPVAIFCTNTTVKNILWLKEEVYFTAKLICYNNPVDIAGVVNFDDLLLDVDDDLLDLTPVEVDPRKDVALILTSSGTTGFPKCVQLTHSNFRITMSYAHDPHCLDINEEDNVMAFLPFFHIFGNAVGLAGILFGSKVAILERFLPERFLTIIQQQKITKLFLVPPILLFLVKHPLVQKFDLSSIDDILVGADAVGKELEEMVKKQLKVKTVRQIYGMTEICGGATVIPRHETKFGSCGKPTPTHKIIVCDVKTGESLPPNAVGELRFKGEGVMKGYLGNVGESETAFDDQGYLKSGDLGCYDEDGYFYIKDRLKEIIKYKGFQVSPAELENLLLQHPGVKDAGVVGKPDERAGEVPVAFVVKQGDKDVTEQEIVSYVAENISAQKHLHGGVKFIEEIPKTPSGKILRRKLKELL